MLSHICNGLFWRSWDCGDHASSLSLNASAMKPESYISPVYTVQIKITQVRPGLQLTRVSFCRVNTAIPGSTRASLLYKTVLTRFDPG